MHNENIYSIAYGEIKYIIKKEDLEFIVCHRPTIHGINMDLKKVEQISVWSCKRAETKLSKNSIRN